MKRISALFLAVIIAALAAGCTPGSEPADTTTAADITEATTDGITVTEPVQSTEAVTSETEHSESQEASAPEETSEAPTEVTPKTTAEIVALFNNSANKIKTDATKVVKNYEKRTVNNDKVVIPAGLESTAESMLASFMKDDTEPIVYATKAEIMSEYLVPDQSYVSKLDPAYVTDATCTDTGTEYKIVLKLKGQSNPTAGVGVGAVCDVIEASEVADKAPFVEEFSTEYYRCVVKATIDKATGRMVKTNYTTPLILKIKVNMFGTHDASIGFTFEKDYTITY